MLDSQPFGTVSDTGAFGRLSGENKYLVVKLDGGVCNVWMCKGRDVIGAPKSALRAFFLRMVKNIFWKTIIKFIVYVTD